MVRLDWPRLVSFPSQQASSSSKTTPRAILPPLDIESISQTLATIYLTLKNKAGLEEDILLKISSDIHNNADGYCCPDIMQDWFISNANISLKLDDIQNLVIYVKIYSSVGEVSCQDGYDIIRSRCSLMLHPSAVDMKKWMSRVQRAEKRYHKKVTDYNGSCQSILQNSYVKTVSNKVVPQRHSVECWAV